MSQEDLKRFVVHFICLAVLAISTSCGSDSAKEQRNNDQRNPKQLSGDEKNRESQRNCVDIETSLTWVEGPFLEPGGRGSERAYSRARITFSTLEGVANVVITPGMEGMNHEAGRATSFYLLEGSTKIYEIAKMQLFMPGAWFLKVDFSLDRTNLCSRKLSFFVQG